MIVGGGKASEKNTEACSWAWAPKSTFELDVMIGGKRLVTVIEGSEREQIAMSLARLADAVMGCTRHLFWRWSDGAESNLDGDTIKEAPDED